MEFERIWIRKFRERKFRKRDFPKFDKRERLGWVIIVCIEIGERNQ